MTTHTTQYNPGQNTSSGGDALEFRLSACAFTSEARALLVELLGEPVPPPVQARGSTERWTLHIPEAPGPLLIFIRAGFGPCGAVWFQAPGARGDSEWWVPLHEAAAFSHVRAEVAALIGQGAVTAREEAIASGRGQQRRSQSAQGK